MSRKKLILQKVRVFRKSGLARMAAHRDIVRVQICSDDGERREEEENRQMQIEYRWMLKD